MKKKFKKGIKIVVIVMVSLILLPFVAFGVQLLTVPISRPNEAVRSYFYRKVPVGTRWDEVLEIIDDKGWEIKGGVLAQVIGETSTVSNALEAMNKAREAQENRV